MSPTYRPCPRRRSTLPLCTAGIVSLAMASSAGAESRKDWKLSLEGGSEYDTNLHRVEVVEGAITGHERLGRETVVLRTEFTEIADAEREAVKQYVKDLRFLNGES